MRALSAKPTAPSATVAASTPRGPRRSATRPMTNAATPPTTRLIDSATDTAPRLQPNVSESTGRKTPNVDTAAAMHDVTANSATTAAKRAVSDAIRHSSLPFFADVRARGGRMLVDVTVGVPDPKAVDVAAVKRELPHGEGAVRAVEGGLRVPVGDTIIACVAITVSID